MLASTLLLASCSMIHPALNRGTIVLKPQVTAGSYGTHTDLPNYTQASIHHLSLKLYTFDDSEHEQGIQKSIPNADLNKVVTFSNLKANTTYRIKAYAYASADDSNLISTEDANSYTDIVLLTDTQPYVGNLKVKLIDRNFNGQGTSSLAVTPGGYSYGATESFIAPYYIETIAGDGTGAYSGDGGPASSARLNGPEGVAVDSQGNIFIADYCNHRIRKIGTDGIIRTAAGNGVKSFAGDGGPATNAGLNSARGVAVDSAGNLYIADTDNHRIRKVDTNGNISTVAGNGSDGYLGDGVAGTSTRIAAPRGVAVDSAGNVYIADTDNHRIRKVEPSGNISTVAGNGTGMYSGDGGPATTAQLNGPTWVALDTQGNLFVADANNNRIRKILTNGNIITIAGNGTGDFSGDGGPATQASLSWPYGVAVDSLGNVYIADDNNQRIRKVGTNGIIDTIAGNGPALFVGDGGPATGARLSVPCGLAVDARGNIYVPEYATHRIRKLH